MHVPDWDRMHAAAHAEPEVDQFDVFLLCAIDLVWDQTPVEPWMAGNRMHPCVIRSNVHIAAASPPKAERAVVENEALADICDGAQVIRPGERDQRMTAGQESNNVLPSSAYGSAVIMDHAPPSSTTKRGVGMIDQ